jgi:nucleotidyltransferase/DNA polymerase involved in DNA repair
MVEPLSLDEAYLTLPKKGNPSASLLAEEIDCVFLMKWG